MSVAFVSVTEYDGTNDPSPASFSHTLGTGADCLVVVSGIEDDMDISDVTYNGVSLTEQGRITHSNPDAAVHPVSEIWGIAGPATGTNTVEVTYAGGEDDGGYGALDFSGVDQTTPFGTTATAEGDHNTDISVDVTSETDGMVVDAANIRGSRTGTVGAGQTERINLPTNVSDNAPSLLSSTEPGASTVTMSWGISGGATRWTTVGTPLNPASGGGGSALPLHRRRRAMMSLAGLTAPVIEALGHVFHRDSESGLMIPQGAAS